MEAQFHDEHLDGLAKMFKDPRPVVRAVDPEVEAGADVGSATEELVDNPQPAARAVDPMAGAGAVEGKASDAVPEVYKGPLTRSRANKD